MVFSPKDPMLRGIIVCFQDISPLSNGKNLLFSRPLFANNLSLDGVDTTRKNENLTTTTTIFPFMS